MERQDILKMVDHTLLTQTATWEEIRTILDDAMTCRRHRHVFLLLM